MNVKTFRLKEKKKNALLQIEFSQNRGIKKIYRNAEEP
jgi:hypothetical protein